FFFQAEDGIRDFHVTGVQTCALPILSPTLEAEHMKPKIPQSKKRLITVSLMAISIAILISFIAKFLMFIIGFITQVSFYGNATRSEERRVGKECRSRGWPWVCEEKP